MPDDERWTAQQAEDGLRSAVGLLTFSTRDDWASCGATLDSLADAAEARAALFAMTQLTTMLLGKAFKGDTVRQEEWLRTHLHAAATPPAE